MKTIAFAASAIGCIVIGMNLELITDTARTSKALSEVQFMYEKILFGWSGWAGANALIGIWILASTLKARMDEEGMKQDEKIAQPSEEK